MTDPSAYLAAALDTAEKLATAAAHRDAHWSIEEGEAEWFVDRGAEILAGGKPILNEHVEYGQLAARHVVQWDPAHVLRMVAAHRKILGRFQDWDEHLASDPVPPFSPEDHAVLGLLRWTVRTLAEAYGWTCDD